MLRFFIDRPIFSSVISIIIVLAGAAALNVLPVEQYPNVVPPQVVVTAIYPGASAEVVAESVAAALEQEINGVDDMIYMETSATDSGSLQLTVSFNIGTDPDQATINVNNRVQAAMARLPQTVRDLGVRVEARSTNILLVAILYSPAGTQDTLYMSNYALLNVLDELARLPGVGDALLFGPQDYSMRIWLRPDKLAEYALTPGDVAAAIREQSAQFAAGRIGSEPSPAGQAFTYTVTTSGQLSKPEEFAQIILRSQEDGSALRLGDVARVVLGAQDYGFDGAYNGTAAVPLGVFLQPGANAVATANRVREALESMSARFPEDVAYAIPYDTTEFVEISIQEVLITLVIAVGLVVLVTFVFLQHLRATLIPVAAIPVSLIGTFAGMMLFGFSINLLTLFGLVLAIGIVVDNAIIVMENVERLMHEKRISARQASIETMQQVSGAVVSSTLVLVAVFAPVTFLGGLSGELYRQFAVTIAVSVVISGVVALTLTPAMCALLLDKEPTKVALPFRAFNYLFNKQTAVFSWIVGFFLRHMVLSTALFAAVVAGAALSFSRLPSGLVPNEDQGYALVIFQLPPASATARTAAVRDEVTDLLLSMEEVGEFTAFAGFDIEAGALRSSSGVGFANLRPWSERAGPGQDAASVAGRFSGMASQIQDAIVFAFTPPPIQGLSLTGGVEGYLEVRGEADTADVDRIVQQLIAAAKARPELMNVRTTLNMGTPRLHAALDREKARAAGVPINEVFQTMQATFGSLYVNDFNMFGRNWQVNLQSEADFRSRPEDLRKIFVRAANGAMVPLSSLVTLERRPGPDTLNRFNVYRAAKLLADPAPGYTTGEAKAALEAVAAELFATENTALGWIGEAYQLDAAVGAAGAAFVLGLLMVFLILAAQYERWTLPLAVASAVPFGILGAALAAHLRGYPNDIYFQVGVLVLIGLSAKNAILIVEFAAQNRREGMSSHEAAKSAASQRFRAIVMTAMTFIIGTVPLVFATGAGAASRREIGTVVVGGMIAASTLALFFIPVAYKLLENASAWFKRKKPVPGNTTETHHA